MTTEGSTIRVLRCRTGALEWAISDEVVREIAPAGPAARVPGAPVAVLGIVNVRGGLLTAVDTRVLLGQPTADLPVSLILVEAGGRRLALAVDEVDDLQVVPIELLEPAGAEDGVPEGAIIAIIREGRPFVLLDVEALVAPLFAAVAGRT